MAITSDAQKVTITSPKSPNTQVEILKFGATVISWKIDGNEKLWLSDNAKLDGSKAVRGGIPLVFPRFGPPSGNHPDTDKLHQHGFARSTEWEFLGQLDEVTAQFGLGPEQLSTESREQWPHDFTLLYTVKLVDDDSIEVSMDVENTDSKPFDFNVLFHTYYRVPDINEISVDGFSNLDYYNKVVNGYDRSGDKPITVAGEVDRVYKSTPRVAVINVKGKPAFTVTGSTSLTDTVVWNPWKKASQQMQDFRPETGFRHMICVENGNVAKFTSLKPNEKWHGAVNIKANL